MSTLDIFERNISHKQGSSAGYQNNCFGDLFPIQSEMFWLSSRTDHVPLPFSFLCFYSCIIQGVKHIKNICHFIVVNTKFLTNEKIIKLWWHKFHKSFNKILKKVYCTFLTKNSANITHNVLMYEHNSTRLTNEKVLPTKLH